MVDDKQQHLLDGLIERLRNAAGERLHSIVLYGSAASQDFHPGFSDLNLLCLFQQVHGSLLDALAPVFAWWEKSGQPQPLVFSLDEVRNAADVFAIEFLDIKQRHRVLFGPDLFADLAVPMDLHRVQVERELRTNLIRLRQAYLAAGKDRKQKLKLLTESISSFVTLFRHSLLALGEKPLQHKAQLIDRLSSILSFDPGPFHSLLDLRDRKGTEAGLDVDRIFAGYLAGVTRVAEEVDRRLAVR